MSSRWYPLYQRGNPQLRVFLPNFYMKIVKPPHEQPPHTVAFNVSMEMTRNDVKNYLEKIYKIPVVGVRIHIASGEFKKNNKGYVIKEDDLKIAYVDLDKSVNFKFPDIFKGERDARQEKELKNMDEIKTLHRKNADRNLHRPGLTGWFSL